MGNMIRGMMNNILLMIAGFLACLAGNFFMGALIGVGAGVLQCTFSGANTGRKLKEAALSSLPVAIVVGVVCGVGGNFAHGLKDIGGWIIAIIIAIMCGFIGSFISGTRYFQEQTGDRNPNRIPINPPTPPAPSAPSQGTPAPVSQSSQRMLDRLHRNQQAAPTPAPEREVPSDYDEVIDTSKGDQAYYNLIKELTGKHVVTKRIIDEAYSKLPPGVLEHYKNDPPLVALTSYAYERRAASAEKEVNNPFADKVKELSGSDQVTESSIASAYTAIPDDLKQDLPTDPKAAIMMLSMGQTMSSIKDAEAVLEKERELARELELKQIEDFYESIPDSFKERLPKDDHAKAVEMFKRGESLPFYDSLDMGFRSRVSYNTVEVLVPNYARSNVEEWLWNNREAVLTEFDETLPPPLSDIPVSALALLLNPEHTYNTGKREAVEEHVDYLADLFENSLPNPLRLVPIQTIWLMLDPKDRQHQNAILKDIRSNLEFLTNQFVDDYDGDQPLESLFLPTCCMHTPIKELYSRLGPLARPELSTLMNVLNHIDRCKRVTAASVFRAVRCPLLSYAPYDMCRAMMQWSTDYDEDCDTAKEYWSKYSGEYSSMMGGDNLPKPLHNIPMHMLWYLTEDYELLNGDSNVSSMYEAILDDPEAYTKFFKWQGENIRSYIPTCCLEAWTNEELDSAFRRQDNDDFYEETWRIWLPNCLAKVPYDNLVSLLQGIPEDRNPTVVDILQQAAYLRPFFDKEEKQEPEYDDNTLYFWKYAPEAMLEQMTAYYGAYNVLAYTSNVLDSSLPKPLRYIPKPMLACLLPDSEKLSAMYKRGEVEEADNIVVREADSLQDKFPMDDMPYPAEALNQKLHDRERLYLQPGIAATEFWRLWLPDELFNVPTVEFARILGKSSVESTSVWDIICNIDKLMTEV